MWNPSNRDLARSWLAYRELHSRGLVLLNPWRQATKALSKYDRRVFRDVVKKKFFDTNVYGFVVENPKAFLNAYNNNMDFLSKDGGCVDPATFEDMLSQLKECEPDALFTEGDLNHAIALLNRTTEIEISLASGKRNTSNGIKSPSTHVTIQHTKKSIKIQQLVSVLTVILGLALIYFLDPEHSAFGILACIGAAFWLAIAIPIQKWWHHG